MGQVLSYGASCFLLIIPVLIWNIGLAGSLPSLYSPERFNTGIPTRLLLAENCARLAVLAAFPLVMRVGLSSTRQKTGLVVYAVGILMYAGAWLAVIRAPASRWSRSTAGFLAPAYTPAIWLAGIGLIGERAFIEWPGRELWYSGLALAFVCVHMVHTLMAVRSSTLQVSGPPTCPGR